MRVNSVNNSWSGSGKKEISRESWWLAGRSTTVYLHSASRLQRRKDQPAMKQKRNMKKKIREISCHWPDTSSYTGLNPYTVVYKKFRILMNFAKTSLGQNVTFIFFFICCIMRLNSLHTLHTDILTFVHT